ncbi:MAG: hypothetical protein QXW97_03885 [Candidatus Pacearchaeota archaeon]
MNSKLEENNKNNNSEIKTETNNKSKKFLFVSNESLSGDLAWQIKKEGHDVKIYIADEGDKDVYDGFLDKIDDWKKAIDTSDVIVFDDIGFGKIADNLRTQGKLVIGGSVYTDKLEEDREFGQEEMKKVGMLILPHWDFSDFDSAIDFIKNNPGRYVFKPSGNTPSDSKGILFLGQEEDGKDLIEILEQNKKAWAKKIKKFQLQKMAVGVEVAVGAFFNGEDFIYPINVNFEYKKLFPGDIGPYTGEMGCYDDKTEVLTKNGWKFFKDLKIEDEICTLNPINNSIEYHKPNLIVSFSHHRELINIKNENFNISVTPDHNMYLCSQKESLKSINSFKFVKARNIEESSIIKRIGNWTGHEEKYFILPSIEINNFEKNQACVYLTNSEIKILMDDWLAFLGLFIAKGSINNNKVIIPKCVSNFKKDRKIKKVLKKLPFKNKFDKILNSYCINNKKIADYLKQFIEPYNSSVPNFIKDLSPRQISIFLDFYSLNNSNPDIENFRIFYTFSKKIADDIQELLLKIGRVGIIKEKKIRKERKIINNFINNFDNSKIIYEIHEKLDNSGNVIYKKDIKKVKYDGVVYCAEVQNHIMFVRKDGKPYFCGNTTMFWSPPNEIFRSTLLKMKNELAKCGYIGYIDINCIANARGIYPLEFTCRFGYPTISIQMEGVTSEWGNFLYELASKKTPELKTKKGFQMGVCVVVPPFPFDDKKEAFIYKDLSILFRKPNLEGVHLGDVKLVNDVWAIAGDSGYVLVITGSGLTMEEARKQTYGRVKNIILQNMYYRTDIGMRWLLGDSDKLQTWGYLY